jgi:hypothetical protein
MTITHKFFICQIMSIFNVGNKEAFGGFKSIELIKVSEILNCPDILTNNNSADFTYISDIENKVDILPVGETIIISAKPVKNRAGILFTVSGGFEINYPSKALEDLFASYLEEFVIVKANLLNNTSMIYGSLLFPLEVNYILEHSKKIENPTRIKVSINSKTPQKPVIL